MEPGAVAMPSVVTTREGEDRIEPALGALRPRLLRWALALGARPEDADDLVQDTLLAAYRNRERFDPNEGTLEGWTALILVRRFRNRRRSWLRKIRFLEVLRHESPGKAVPGVAAAEARMTLARLLRALTDRQREVVALYEIGQLSAEETARVLGVTAAGVRSIARDARRRLATEAESVQGEGVRHER
jgi:RNA polymerase sigma-70 factor (ECF subfamily)